MRVTRIRVATGLFALVVALALTAGAAAMANRPHPLFGNPILGNSAEIAHLWSTGSVGASLVRVTDFEPASGTLVSAYPLGIIGGPFDPRYQQLDLVTGDFDGDGRDDVVAAYGKRTADTYAQTVALWVMSVDTTTLLPATRYQGAIGPTEMAPGSYRAQGTARLAAGQFDTDAPQEFVLARRADDHVVVTLMELDPTGTPVVLDSLVGMESSDDLKESARFDVAAGDFDGDGIDEVVVGGVHRRTDAGMELVVTVYACESGALVERLVSAYGNQPQGTTSQGQGYYFDHVAIATGRLRAELKDQIVFSWTRRLGEWWEDHGACWPFIEDEFWVTTNPHLVTLVVGTSGTWSLSGWNVDAKEKSYKEIVYQQCSTSPSDLGYTTTSLGLSVGDLTGDGVDEVAWAAYSRVFVYQADPAASYALVQRDSLSRTRPYKDPSRRVVEIADLDAAAGGTEAWRSELVVMDWPSDQMCTRVLRATTNTAGTITGFTTVSSMQEAIAPQYCDVALACGDFDGDGIRLGEPTEHAITDALQPSVVLGAPPVHFDVFPSDTVDVTGCYPGYTCTDFGSSYSVETSIEFALSTEIAADWGLSTTLKGHAEGFGARVEGSFGATYGQGFGRTSSESHTYQASYTVTATGGDRILADLMSYDLWEYPVYGAGRQVLGHVSVIEPGSVEPTVQWMTSDSWEGIPGSCAPAGTHEVGDLLSYPKTIPATGAYGDRWKYEAVGWPVAHAGGKLAPRSSYAFDLRWSDISGGSFTRSWKAGLEVGASIAYEASDPVGELKAGVSAEVKGTYDASELSTHTFTVGQDIHIGAALGDLHGEVDAPYTVFPYVYRSATTGALVLDYRVVPGGAGTWWDTYRGAPDLTFTLPRLHHGAKGIPLWDPTSRNRSPDVRVYPGTAAVGETVQVRAIVRNHSLVDCAAPATVRFRAVDPHGATFVMQDLDGDTTFATTEAIPQREGRPVTFQWVVPPYAADTLRVTAEVDPHGAVAEVHEDNNSGYVEFYAVGGNVDVPDAAVVAVPFRLERPVPNPFRGATRIAFSLPSRTRARLEVYDVTGRLVARLVDGERAAGRHVVEWDGRALDGARAHPGVYLCRYVAGDRHETRRLVRLD
jgi:hypothetical protein